MSLWKMGVGININNSSFKFGKRVYALLNGALTSGNSFFFDNDTGAAEGHADGLRNYLNSGDKILIGPSTASTYEGQTQVVTINTIDIYNEVNFYETLVVQFANNDPITAIGSRMPAGWLKEEDTESIIYRLFDSETLSLSPIGYYSRYRMQIYQQVDANVRRAYSRLNKDQFIASINYRMGFYYQFLRSSTVGRLKCGVRDTSTNPWGTELLVTSGDVASWTAYNSSAIIAPSSLGTYWDIFVGLGNLTSPNACAANIADIYLEHAQDTDDETSGVYTFDDYPIFGSRNYEIVRSAVKYRLRNNDMFMNDPTGGGDKSKKYVISAQFKDAPSSLRENLAILEDWQDRGYFLVLHHDIPSIPNNLYGFLTIKDTSLEHWSSNYSSFNITFEQR